MAFQVTTPSGQVESWTKAIGDQVATAATASVREAGRRAQAGGRASIAGAGFGARWQSGLQLNVFPTSGASLNPVAVLRHRIGLASVFEEGAHISGQPLLWIPIKQNLPGRTRGSWSPKTYARTVGPLVSFRGRGNRPPILGARVNGKIVPLFVGVGGVNIPKKFDVRAAYARAAAELPEIFKQALGQ